jgi:RNA polymerase sigma factor (sigma-70 family)
MDELSKLIQDIKKDKNKFSLLLNRMEPLINKYVRILYKDEKEDIYSELCCALWEAVCKISFYKNDGEIMIFMINALQNKFHELYRISRKNHDFNTPLFDADACEIASPERNFDNILLNEDIRNFLDHFSGKRKRIFYYILIHNLSDSEIAKKLHLSRQYVNRIRKILRTEFYDYFNL